MNKIYVDVEEEQLSDGGIIPRCIKWKREKAWNISRVLHTCYSTDHSFDGIRYTVIIGNQTTHIYRDNNGWYVCPITQEVDSR